MQTEVGENADVIREMLGETLEKIDEEKYFDGIDYFQSYLNKKMKNLTQLLADEETDERGNPDNCH